MLCILGKKKLRTQMPARSVIQIKRTICSKRVLRAKAEKREAVFSLWGPAMRRDVAAAWAGVLGCIGRACLKKAGQVPRGQPPENRAMARLEKKRLAEQGKLINPALQPARVRL